LIHTILTWLLQLWCFQASKEKEEKMVENVPIETPSEDHPEMDVNPEIVKIASQNLTPSDGQDAAKTIAGGTPNDTDREERVEV
jgi:hypothetical protein